MPRGRLPKPWPSVMRRLCRAAVKGYGGQDDGMFTVAQFHNAYTRVRHVEPWSSEVHDWLDSSEFVVKDGRAHYRLVETPPEIGTTWEDRLTDPIVGPRKVQVVGVDGDWISLVPLEPAAPPGVKSPLAAEWLAFVAQYDPWVPNLWARLLSESV